MKLALAQMRMSEDREENLRKSMDRIAKAAEEKADLVLFPEVQLTPFFAQYSLEELEQRGGSREAMSIPWDSPVIRQFQEAAGKHQMMLSPNFYVRERDGAYYDRSYLIGRDGGILGTSEMVHIYSADHFRETDYYTPSRTGFRVYDTAYGKIGIVICFDRHLFESVRSCAMQGAALVLIPTANLREEPMDLFEAEVRTEAFQNNVFIAMCNRTGREGGIEFAGTSLVVDPEGNVIARAGEGEELLTAEIDPVAAARSRERRPWIRFVMQ